MATRFSQEQIDVGRTILRVGQAMGANQHQMRAAFSAGWVESRFKNLNYGDRDSLGVFQQRPSQGWGTPAQIMNVEYASRKFFEEAMRVSQTGSPGQLAQRVQRSAYPKRYDEQIAVADEMLALVSGGNNSVPLSFPLSALPAGVVMIGALALIFLITD